jgi:hypothetical protein
MTLKKILLIQFNFWEKCGAGLATVVWQVQERRWHCIWFLVFGLSRNLLRNNVFSNMHAWFCTYRSRGLLALMMAFLILFG